jgi:alanyl-tRNA synthetase
MVTKQELLKKFQSEPEKHWKVDMFDKEKFNRQVCPSCDKGFWSMADRDHCPDPGCGEEYGFLGNPITKKKWDYVGTWKLLEKFFVKNGHTSVARYPVVARWRNDLFFNIASIVDFQRFDNGVMTFDYPANPLIVPQMCLRFPDVQNVGITGRHHTSFMMPGQHAFNAPKEGYWKDECIDLNFRFLTKEMGIPKKELIYMEDLWTMPDFSALGPYIETFSRGLELVNSGFMGYGYDNGVKELPTKVIDVGWGLERLVWFSNGTPTGYEAVFGPVLDKVKKVANVEYDKDFFFRYAKIAGLLNIDEVPDLKKARESVAKELNVTVEELEKNVAPLEAIYSICDYSRTLALAISDGALPSNVGGGYNLRLILRRAMSFIEKFGWDLKLEDVASWHADYLKPIFPELKEHENDIKEILEVEKKRYSQSAKRSEKIIQSFEGKPKEEELIKLYDTEGITPEQLGADTPPDFYEKITERHMGVKPEEKKFPFDVTKVNATTILYYDDPEIFDFTAKVVKVFKEDGKTLVVLDQTAFYPTSGGQMHDTGLLGDAKVTNVIKIGNVIVHTLASQTSIKEGDTVKGKVDKKRRDILRTHHDAIHIINGAVQKVVGRWCHQYGAEKDIDKARIDVTHYEGLTEEQVDRIEKMANDVVSKGMKITKEVLNRSDVEKKHGFSVYTGGYVPSKKVRLVSIEDYDIETCGGTHGNNTKEVGPIMITKTKRIADGLVRIEIKAGSVAIQDVEEKAKILKEVAEKLGVKENKVGEATEELFKKWKKLRKQNRKKTK